jgi:hypothetical protein
VIPVSKSLKANGERSMHHKRHPDWEPYDKVTIELVPRLKTSGMSGDEWRTGVKTILWHKGRPIVEDFRTNLRFAIANLAALIEGHSCPIDTKVIEIERHSCDQPSCTEPAVSVYKLKEQFSDRGERLHPDEGSYADHYRQFCARHLYRGDCGREDSDDNYVVIHGPGPHESQERSEDESPAQRMVVQVDSMDDLPAAIEQARKDLG